MDTVLIFLELTLCCEKRNELRHHPDLRHPPPRGYVLTDRNVFSKEHISLIKCDNDQCRLRIWGNFSEGMRKKMTLEKEWKLLRRA